MNPRYQKGTLVFETSSFDRSDNSPFLIFYINFSLLPFHQILALSGKKERKQERNLITYDNTGTQKPFVHAGSRVILFHEGEDFSSAARYDHFDTLPFMSAPVSIRSPQEPEMDAYSFLAILFYQTVNRLSSLIRALHFLFPLALLRRRFL